MRALSHTRWQLFANESALYQTAVNIILNRAQQAIDTRGQFLIVLAGGNTPRKLYQALSQQPAQWQHWHIYFNDERCLPADHAERNSLMAQQAWLQHVDIPPTQIHAIPAELGAQEAKASYQKRLASVGDFDLVLLGLGEDGHTASLFPHHPVAHGTDVIAVSNAPKPPAERVSMSAQRLSRAHIALFLVTGADKQAALDDWRTGQPIPASTIQASEGVTVLCSGVLFN